MKNKNLKSRILVKFAIPALVLGLFFNSNVVKGEDFSWTQRSMPSNATWYDVAYGNGKFVAVTSGSSNKAAVSTDGESWTASTLPVSASWESIAYGNGTFVAIANNSSIASTSSDGVNWTQRAMPSYAAWNCLTYGDGKFVAIAGGSTKAATSLDGITWNAITLPVSRTWSSVAYGDVDGGLFVAVSNNNSTTAITSPDGVTWTQRTLPVSANWRSLGYGNGKFVAGTIFSSGVVAISSDGTNWTQATMPFNYSYSITYGNGVFVSVGGTYSATSPDGITWTQRTLPSGQFYSVTYGNRTFVAVAGGSYAASSTGGIMPSANTSTDINLGLDSIISLTCTDSITMGTITGTGQSNLTTNEALCTVSTNNSTGYALYWQASTAYLENGTGDQITAYTPTTPDTPENWEVSATESEWGAKLKSGSTTYNSTTWGDDDTYSNGNWLNISAASPYQIITRTTETSQAGDSETLLFGAEIGSNKFQPTGTYDVDVTVTATTL